MKLTTHSFEIEQRVLENLMAIGEHNSMRVQKAFLKITGDCFYTPDNQHIFAMVKSSFMKQQGFNFVDIMCLIGTGNHELHDALTWIMDNYRQFSVNTNSLESDIDKLLTLAMLRKQLYIIENMIPEIKNCPDPNDAHDILVEKLGEVSNLNHRESKCGISNIEIAEAFYDGKIGEDMKIPTTCDQLNEALGGGIMPKSLIIVAAGASVGKTGFSIYLLDSIARAQPDTESLFFSIEMEYKHIWQRHVGICGGKQFDKLSYDERMGAVTKSLQIQMKIYDTAITRSTSDIDFILTTARLRAMEKPISVIVVDYLGLVQNKGSFERNDLKQSDITGKLAQLAIELNCTVIALSQINRGAANRGTEDRCPWPHDAADSSGGHRSSSLWLGVDRPELYQDDPCYRNQFVVKCRKNRFGNTFDLIFAFNEGTFAEVPSNWFRQPMSKPKNAEQAIFSGHGKDFYPD